MNRYSRCAPVIFPPSFPAKVPPHVWFVRVTATGYIGPSVGSHRATGTDREPNQTTSMKTSPELQAIIAEIAAKHKLDLSSPDATLELSLPGYNDLRIQRLDEHRVSVSHRYETDSGPAVDPDVIFFTGLDEWVPVAIQDVTGYREVAEVDHGAIAHVRPRGQSEVATLCRVWARNLREQGWLELAAIPGSSGRRPPRS